MTDHKQKAEWILTRYADTLTAASQLAIAQVHATLYLAEQQKIANIIAASNLTVTDTDALKSLFGVVLKGLDLMDYVGEEDRKELGID